MIFINVDTAVEVPANVAPLTDDTDFKTIETAVAHNAAGMDLVWNFITPGGTITQTAVTPTSGGVYDWTHVGDGMYKMEIPASGGGSINNDTEGTGYFTGSATGILPWRGPDIVFRPAAVNNALVGGSDNLQVDVVEISGDSTAADNLESYCDGTTPQPVNATQISGSGTAADNAETVFATDFATNYGGNMWVVDLSTDAGETLVDDVWDEVLTAHTTANSGGKVLLDVLADVTGLNGEAMRGTDSAYTGTPPTAAAIADQVWDEAQSGHTTVGTFGYYLDSQVSAAGGGGAPTAAAIADAVWTEAIADHSGTSGSTAEALNAAGGSGDPWVTTLPASYTGTQAGKILADILDDVTGINGDAMRGTDGANTTTPPTAAAIRAEMDSNSTQFAAIFADTNALTTTGVEVTGFSTEAKTDIQDCVWTDASTRTLSAFTFTTDANLTQIEGHALAGTGTQIADGFEHWFNVATPGKTMNDAGVAGSGLSAADVWTYATRTLTSGGGGSDPEDIADAVVNNLSALVVVLSSPYDEKTDILKLVQGSDYKSGTPLGPLSFKLSANNISAGDDVYFGAKLEKDGTDESIYVAGTVADVGGTLYAQFDLEGSTDLTGTPSHNWRWGLKHENGSGDVQDIKADLEMWLLENRVSS